MVISSLNICSGFNIERFVISYLKLRVRQAHNRTHNRKAHNIMYFCLDYGFFNKKNVLIDCMKKKKVFLGVQRTGQANCAGGECLGDLQGLGRGAAFSAGQV